MKNCIQYILGLLSVCLLAGCQTTLVEQYVNLEYSELAVQGNGGTYEIGVESYDVWQVVQDECDWVEVEVLGEDSFSVNVLPNMSSEERECVIEVSSGEIAQKLTIKQTTRVFSGDFYDLLKLGKVIRVSSNCSFAVGLSYDKELKKTLPYVCDFSTGDIKAMDIGKSVYGLRTISNDGRTIVISIGNKSEVYRDGNKVEYELPSGYSSAEIVTVSEDGSMMIGNLYQGASSCPAVWENGKIKSMLPLPQTNAYGQSLPYGVKVRGASADCSVIYGSEPSTLGLIYWKNGQLVDISSQNATIKTVFVDNWGVIIEAVVACTVNVNEEFTCASPNGRYIAAKYTDYVQKEDGVPAEKYNYPALVDTETGEVKIIKTDVGDAMGITADDNGLVFGGTPALAGGGMKGYVFNASDDTYMSLPEWFMQNYGIVIDKDRLVYKVSSDMKTFFGMKRCNDFESWFLRIDD